MTIRPMSLVCINYGYDFEDVFSDVCVIDVPECDSQFFFGVRFHEENAGYCIGYQIFDVLYGVYTFLNIH